jgi:hypothetical protein
VDMQLHPSSVHDTVVPPSASLWESTATDRLTSTSDCCCRAGKNMDAAARRADASDAGGVTGGVLKAVAAARSQERGMDAGVREGTTEEKLRSCSACNTLTADRKAPRREVQNALNRARTESLDSGWP